MFTAQCFESVELLSSRHGQEQLHRELVGSTRRSPGSPPPIDRSGHVMSSRVRLISQAPPSMRYSSAYVPRRIHRS
jgi:hypothetical protein